MGTLDYRKHRLHRLLAPRSITVVGVSAKRRNIGSIVMENIKAGGFKGKLIGIGREQSTVAGSPVMTSLHDAGGTDLAVVSVPASQVLATIQTGINVGIKNYAIITAGFAESHEMGAGVQAELGRIALENDLAILGPNTVGFINYRAKANASFAPWWRLTRPPGDVAVISQSGGTAGAIMVLGERAGARFSYVIGSGNEAVLDLVDYMYYVASDPRIRTIALYIEGLRRGRELVRTIAEMRGGGKHVVVLTAARRASAARAAVSHTGSLATPGEISRQVLEQAGAIVVSTPQEAAGALAILSSRRALPKSGNVLLFADAGGSGVLASDLADEAGLSVPELPKRVQAVLKQHIPEYGSAKNPLDPTPTVFGDQERLTEVLRVGAASPNVASLAVASAHDNPGAVRMAKITAEALKPVEKFCFAVWNAGSTEVGDQYLRYGIPYFDDPRLAFESLSRVLRANSMPRESLARAKRAARTENGPGHSKRRSAQASGKVEVLTEDALESSFESAGIRVVAARLASTVTEAVAAARAVGFPVVLKAISPDVPHRGKVGALALDVTDERAVRSEYARIERTVRALGGRCSLDGMIVQAQVTSPVEAFLGVRYTPGFGPVAAVGLGGPAVEQQGQVGFALVPAEPHAILGAVQRSPLLRASLNDAHRKQFVHIAEQILGWWISEGEILGLIELDVNPIMFDSNGAFVADALALRQLT
jgi:acyl-CoA synthetase (NDP forming)